MKMEIQKELARMSKVLRQLLGEGREIPAILIN
jgi:hypothetical protein